MSISSPERVAIEQERLWALEQASQGNPAGVHLMAVRIEGALDMRIFRHSINEIVHRHDALRSTFAISGGQLIRSVDPEMTVDIEVIDLALLPEFEWEGEILRQASEEVKRPFNLASGALIRASILRFSREVHVLIVTVHGIVFDRQSARILLQDLAETYGSLATDRSSNLPALTMDEGDFAAWQRQWLRDVGLGAHLAYWKKQLSGDLPVLDLSTDFLRTSSRTFQGGAVSRDIPETIALALDNLCQKEGWLLFDTFLAAYFTLLHRYTDQDDILVGTPTEGRTHPDSQHLIGRFEHPIAFRADLSGNPSFREVVRRVSGVVASAQAACDLPFGALLKELHLEVDPSRHPLFQAAFQVQSRGAEVVSTSGLVFAPLIVENTLLAVDLSLSLSLTPERMTATLVYSTDLFEQATIERLMDHLEALLTGISQDPDRPIWDLPLLSSAEERRILGEWNKTAADFPRDKCIHEVFEAQVEQTTEEPAVLFEGQSLTYAELNRKANQLARRLRSLGAGPDVIVGIFMERSLDLLVSLLGILKAGAAFLPLDPTYPKDRLAFMLEDSRAPVVITQERLLKELPAYSGGVVLCVESEREALARESTENLPRAASAGDLAYVIYTSGSTGKPKGVLLEHRGAVNLAAAQARTFELSRGDRVLQFARLSFDAAVWEVLMALLTGAALCMAPQDVLRPGRELLDLLVERRITAVTLPPSVLASFPAHELPSLRNLILAGEPCPEELVNAWAAGRRFWNAYGPTETTVCATIAECFTEGGKPPIGRPIANAKVYVLSRSMKLLPVGVAGELYIGGPGVARGYLNRPELTAERFVGNPFSADPGERLYKTGDRVRWLPNGELEYLGRIDQQVKLRGFRIELGEIEAVLMRHQGVREAVVILREDVVGDKRLVAYIVPKSGVKLVGAELRKLLEAKLPDYMVPSVFVELETLPLTPSNKVDRNGLPVPVRGPSDEQDGFAAPRTPTEELLATIWAETLGLDRVSTHDHFLELGGHSLIAARLLSRVHDVFKLNLPLRTLFDAPTVSDMARVVDSSRGENDVFKARPVVRISRDKSAPLSYGQQQIWLLMQVSPGVPFYNEPATLRIPGPLDVDALERSLQEITRRHEILRTSFIGMRTRYTMAPRHTIAPASTSPMSGAAPSAPSYPTQTVLPTATFMMGKLDLTHLPEAEREPAALRAATENACRPFDLALGPLLRALLVKLGPEDHRLYLTMHHIVTDGVSLRKVLVEELYTIYKAFAAGEASPLPPLDIQYMDYAYWQRRTHTVDALEPQIAYWERKLASLPTLSMPTDKPRPALQTFRGATHRFVLSKSVIDRLKAQGAKEGATTFMTLLAAFNVLLHHYSRQTDIVVGTATAGRSRPEFEHLLGYFVNTPVLRTDLSGNPTFRELVKRVRQVALEAYANQDVPFQMLVEELRINPTRSQNPIFQVAFVMDPPMPKLECGWAITPHEVDTRTSKFDLTLYLHERSGETLASFEYDTELFEASTIERMAVHFQNVLTAVADAPLARISNVSLLTPEERMHILEISRPRMEISKDKCLHEIFEEQAAQRPTATAVVQENRARTYRQIDRQANQLANHLRKLGVGPDTMVGLCVDRSIGMLVGILGILKAGGAYVPLDPEYPAPRLAFMASDAGMPVIVAERRFLEKLPSSQAKIVCLDTDWPIIDKESDQKPESGVGPDNLAYAIYTSGSTGKPKGALIQHHNVVRLFRATDAWFGFNEKDVWTMFHSYAFDFSVWEIWGALLYGGRLVIVPFSVSRSPEAFYQLLCVHKVTVLSQTPSAFRQLVQVDELSEIESELSLRYVIFGGEALDIPALKPWLERHGDQKPKLINMYGITETTVHVTYRSITIADLMLGPSSRIGGPIPDLGLYILDPNLQIVPVGVAGEMFIAGAGLARGYLNRPELTAERFVQCTLGDEPEMRLYRSGDLGRYLANGDIEYLGRIDQQVKVRGFRIELREIEAILVQHPDIRESLALVREDTPGDQRVVAYLVKSKQRVPTTSELRTFLREKLPDYMIPSAFVFLDKIPLTVNGKVNRMSLPAPDRNRPSLMPVFRLPTNPIEMVLLSIWRQILKVDNIGIGDDFFALGGHSLLAAQMIARVRERFRIDVRHSSFLLRQFLENSTISGFADAIEMVREASPSIRGRRTVAIDFDAEAVLDSSLRFEGQPVDPEVWANPSTIFLTGGSGFLGAYLLLELLRQTHATIYCHVRANNEETAFQRLRNNMEQYDLWEENFAARIIAVPGDLSLPLLGLSPERFAELSEQIDVIHHNGSFVNFLYPYTAMKAANVRGTQEIIRLASEVRMKPVHYVSTLSVLAGFGFYNVKEMGEDVPLAHGDKLYMGYTESKYVAEKVLMLAAKQGLPVRIYRPKDVTGHTRTGVWKTDSFACSVFRAFIDLGAVPDIPLPLDYVPVDYVSKAIVHISKQILPNGKVFHLNNRRYLLLSQIIDEMRAYGYPLRRVSYPQFVQELVDFTGRQPTSPITPFVPIFVERWSDEKLTHMEMFYEGRLPKFECQNTVNALKGTDIECPPVTPELLAVYLNYFIRTGFLPAPPVKRESDSISP